MECFLDPSCSTENLLTFVSLEVDVTVQVIVRQISSELKAVKLYIHGSGLHGFCVDPEFSKLHLHVFVLSVLFSWAPKASVTPKTES